MQFNEIIKDLRKEKGLTQADLAVVFGTTQDTISLWELGKSYPNVPTLIEIAQYFNVTTDYLLGLSDF